MRKAVSKMYINLILDMYEGPSIILFQLLKDILLVLRVSPYGVTEDFNVEVGVHQVSALSANLFSVVMD